MITNEYEMIIAQHGNFTLVVTHSKIKEAVKAEGEKKEGDAAAPAAEKKEA